MNNSIKIAAVGDISLGDHYLCCGYGVRAKIEKEGGSFIFKSVGQLLSEHDIVFGNLEGVLSSYNYKKNRLSSCQMRGMPEAVEGLNFAKFNILSLANNHIMQHGEKPVYETMDILEKNGIGYCGINNDANIKCTGYTIEKNNIRICFLAYNDRPQQYFIDVPIYTRFVLENVFNDIEHYKEQTDIIIISLHWGDEFIEIPSQNQQDIAHQLIDCGAHIVLGHHPHVVQGIESYRDGLIYYSLGNFVFDQPWFPKCMQSLIVSLEYNKHRQQLSYEIIPIKINQDFQPEPNREEEKKQFISYLTNISKQIQDNKYISSDELSNNYEQKLKKISVEQRRLSHVYWRKNFYHSRWVIIIQYIYEIFIRRLNLLFFWRKGNKSKDMGHE
ncbi:MAG: CapA family protein [Candidatus Hodarchaeota archaeon]